MWPRTKLASSKMKSFKSSSLCCPSNLWREQQLCARDGTICWTLSVYIIFWLTSEMSSHQGHPGDSLLERFASFLCSLEGTKWRGSSFPWILRLTVCLALMTGFVDLLRRKSKKLELDFCIVYGRPSYFIKKLPKALKKFKLQDFLFESRHWPISSWFVLISASPCISQVSFCFQNCAFPKLTWLMNSWKNTCHSISRKTSLEEIHET